MTNQRMPLRPRVSLTRPLLSSLLLGAALLLALSLRPGAALADPGIEAPLAPALALQADGRFEDAAAAFAALAASEGPQRRLALIGLAECREALQDWAGAADAWWQAMSLGADKAERAAAVFRAANTLQQSGAHLRAARLYAMYLWLQPHSHARVEALRRAGDCYVRGGRAHLAVTYYRQALEATEPSELRVELVGLLADAHILRGDVSAALALFQEEAGRVPESEQPRFQYRWATVERAAGLEMSGLDRMRVVFQSYPQSSFAHASLVALVEAGQEVDDYQRGMVNYHARSHDFAVAAFLRHIEADAEGHRGSAHYYAGLSLRALRRYPEAVTEFDWLIDTHPGDPFIPAGMLAKGEAQDRAGDYSGAAQTYLSLADQFPGHEMAPEAVLKAGLALEAAGRGGEARDAYIRLYNGYPAAPQAPEAAMRVGLVAYRAGDQAAAEEALGTAASLCGGCGDANRYQFWLAKVLTAQGNSDEATALLQTIAGRGAGDYYSYRAIALLQGYDPLGGAPDANILLGISADARAQAEEWLQRTFDPSWQPGQPAPALAADRRWQALQEYHALGLRQQAIDTALALGRDLRRDAIAVYTLALWLRDAGLYRPSIQVASNIIYTQPDAANTVPRFIWSLAYPTYFGDLVLKEAAAGDVDPLLFFALMRQESLFDAVIGSHAGAQGLAQVMPATGEWIAGQIGDRDYTTAKLLRPYVSIRYGVWYLAQQIDYFDGNAGAALAAYNAGPGSASRWLALSGNDADLFYETIAFSETRRYLSTVLPNYYRYRQLYAARG